MLSNSSPQGVKFSHRNSSKLPYRVGHEELVVCSCRNDIGIGGVVYRPQKVQDSGVIAS